MGAGIVVFGALMGVMVVILMRVARALYLMSTYYERSIDENRLIRLEVGKVAEELQKIRQSLPAQPPPSK